MDDFAQAHSAAPVVPGYDVGRRLGRGGSATVWLVTEQSTGRDFALKCFAAGGTSPESKEAEEETRREVRILSALDHHHLVRAHTVVRLHWPPEEHGGGGDGLGLALDYAPGGSLAALVAGRGRLGPGETVTVLTPIAQALAYLHGHGFTHGDVAPGNVLFTAHGKPLLADLGVARMVADANAVAEAGTEGFRDPAPVDAVRAGLQPERDIYSLAALGWYCLTGHAPEPGEQRPPLPLLVPGVPAALAAALEAGLHEDRRLRPAAAELAAAVYRSAGAEPVDLSGTVHPTVIPQLLTRRALPRSPRGLKAERLRTWFRIRPGRAGRAAEPRLAAGPRRAGARHRSGTNRSGTSGYGSRGDGRRGLRAAPAGLALVLLLSAAWLLAGTRLPSPFPAASTGQPGPAASERSAAGSTPEPPPPEAATPATVPQDVQALLRSADPEEAVRGLARLRSVAFNSGDMRLLDEVNAPASSAAVADGRIGARLSESGHVLTGFSTLLTAVETSPDSSPSRAVVAVSVASNPYQERDAAGALVAEAAAGDQKRLRLVLVPVDGRWRIQEILPGS
ncbi:serine/threonine-protein kinase [Pseudarthrobacter sp. O4]|uniref:serine/threonine-protein kinase n=1 Tax=Pseudarthrobacter sp. O4 TaxID=3418417 RepID=UPI003CF2895A